MRTCDIVIGHENHPNHETRIDSVWLSEDSVMAKVYKRKTKVKRDKERNPFVAPLRFKSGGGQHLDRKKERNRRCCRENNE